MTWDLTVCWCAETMTSPASAPSGRAMDPLDSRKTVSSVRALTASAVLGFLVPADLVNCRPPNPNVTSLLPPGVRLDPGHRVASGGWSLSTGLVVDHATATRGQFRGGIM